MKVKYKIVRDNDSRTKVISKPLSRIALTLKACELYSMSFNEAHVEVAMETIRLEKVANV